VVVGLPFRGVLAHNGEALEDDGGVDLARPLLLLLLCGGGVLLSCTQEVL